MLFLDGNSLTKISDKHAMIEHIENMVKNNRVNEFIERVHKVGTNVKQNHLDVLVVKSNKMEYLETLFDTYQEMAGFWWMVLQLADEVEAYILSANPKLDPKEVVKQVEALRELTWLEEQSADVKKIAEMIRKINPEITATEINYHFVLQNESVSDAIREHVKKYEWFGTHHWSGEPYTSAKCLEEVKRAFGKEVSHEKKNPNAKDSMPLLQLMAELSFWRTHCAEVTAKVVFSSRPRLDKMANENSLTYEQLLYLSSREIISYLKQGKTLPNKMPERKEQYGHYFDEDGVDHLFLGNELKQLLDQMVEKHETNVKELKGQVACKGGIIQGTVKVVISPNDFSHFKEGDILVVPETTPDFIPLMKRAKAVITDRGGITSHAAIVSRELGVPCITGTLKATSVFKSGEKVEVDAGMGIIKKL
jgi:phosphoenolpyruvate synthase/pyruvate phosphate dikinase